MSAVAKEMIVEPSRKGSLTFVRTTVLLEILVTKTTAGAYSFLLVEGRLLSEVVRFAGDVIASKRPSTNTQMQFPGYAFLFAVGLVLTSAVELLNIRLFSGTQTAPSEPTYVNTIGFVVPLKTETLMTPVPKHKV